MAKGQLRSNREKKKPKADKNQKKAAPVASPFTPAWPTGQKTVGYSEPGVPSKTVEVGDLSGGRNSPIECSSVLYESMTAARRAEMRPSSSS
jgi:hypothetical protein